MGFRGLRNYSSAKRAVKDHKAIAEKLDEFSVLIVALEEDTQVPVRELFYTWNKL